MLTGDHTDETIVAIAATAPKLGQDLDLGIVIVRYVEVARNWMRFDSLIFPNLKL